MITYLVQSQGNVPASIEKMALRFQGKLLNTENVCELDSLIDFLVVDLNDCHGNISKDKTAWLTDKNNNWSIDFKTITT